MLHVLLVEDSPSDVMLIREGMRRSHIAADVEIAYDGAAAVELLAESRFDLVILDLNIPKLSGHAILQQHLAGVEMPVIVFTGSENPTDREIAQAFGAKDFVVKPKEFLPFMEAVKHMLEGSLSAAHA